MKIYLASPFFNGQERPNVEKVRDILKDKKLEVFVPMEHFVEDGENMPNEIWANEVFKMDKKAIDECDVLVCLYYGLYSDSGTSWEVGYAYSKNKKIVVVHMDETKESSLMISSCADVNLAKIEEIVTLNFKYLKNNGFFCHKEQK